MNDDPLAALQLDAELGTRFVGRELRYFETLRSTNEACKDLARAGAHEGTTVVADYQLAGRGRMGRVWLATPGSSLLVSVILRPSLDELHSLTMAAALAMVQAVEGTTELRASIKWPNDVEIAGKKVCGILVETEVERGSLLFAVLGAGLNVSFDPRSYPEIADRATSLSLAAGRSVDRGTLLRLYLEALERYYLAGRQGIAIWREWRDRLETLGKWVRLTSGGSVLEGWAEDVDESGRLYIRHTDGKLTTALAGEVSLRLAQPPS